MEPISATIIVSALMLGAAAVAEEAVKDAYKGLKTLIKDKYAKAKMEAGGASLEALESQPDSKAKKASVEEDLKKAGTDPELDPVILEKAKEVIEVVEREKPDAAAAVGIDWEGVKALRVKVGNLNVARGIGMRAKDSELGEVEIGDVKIGEGQDPR